MSTRIFRRCGGRSRNSSRCPRLFVDGVLLQGLNMLLTLVAYGVFMWRIHPALTAACLSVAAPLWWVTHYYSGRLRPGYLRNRELSDNLVQLFTESVRGMQTIKGFAAEPQQTRRFEEGNTMVLTQQQRIFWDLSVFTPATQLLSQLSLVILFAYGGWLYVRGQIPLGRRSGRLRGSCSSNSTDRSPTSPISPTRSSRASRRRAAFLKCWTCRWASKANLARLCPAG
jgi:ABC-type multidrug transport system fused ATPase/permease subunit